MGWAGSAAARGGWQPESFGVGAREWWGLVLDVKSWLWGLMCQVEECPSPGGPVKSCQAEPQMLKGARREMRALASHAVVHRADIYGACVMGQ